MTIELTEEQRRRALEVMKAYLAAKNPDGTTPSGVQRDRDAKRIHLIEEELGPLLNSYLGGTTSLADFKSRVDGLNKRHEYWGFKGIKGQMFFNMVVNVADDLGECDQELKASLAAPTSEDMASSRIKTFASYVKRIGDQSVEAGGSIQGKPKVGSIPFFLSYFWQIQDREVWPVFYTNSVIVLTDLNLWRPEDDPAPDYLAYKKVHDSLRLLFTDASGHNFSLYDVEHIFWFLGGNPYGGNKPLALAGAPSKLPASKPTAPGPAPTLLPDSYIPPIVGVLAKLSRNDPELREASKASGTSLERAFEKCINAAFTMLGFDAKLLGQGQGRVPDGIAVSADDSYRLSGNDSL